MDLKNIEQEKKFSLIHFSASNIILCVVVCLLVAVPIGVISYYTGYSKGKQQVSDRLLIKSNKLQQHVQKTFNNKSSVVSSSANQYTLSYISPPGWRTMQWHPDSDSTQ